MVYLAQMRVLSLNLSYKSVQTVARATLEHTEKHFTSTVTVHEQEGGENYVMNNNK